MQKANDEGRVPGSFRDPSGFLYRRDGILYRQVNRCYREQYDRLMDSGLYRALVEAGLLVPHAEVEEAAAGDDAYRVIKPEAIPFVTYPYEWSFSQLKQAALATLAVQKLAFEFGMTLKDASAYNVQFRCGRAVFIDTLSFDLYRPGEPWIAYRQFCQHFLAPLALICYSDVRLNQLFKIFIDGIPLDLASSLLPLKTRLKAGLLTHIHLHAKSQLRFAGKQLDPDRQKISRLAYLGLIDSLETTVKKMRWQPVKTAWTNYYDKTSYSEEAMEYKKQLVSQFLDQLKPDTVWDLGANTGIFSRIAGDKGFQTIAFEYDPVCVEMNFCECTARGDTNVLPLVLDLTNPTPAIGWENKERFSLAERGPAGTVLALALIHHLVIANNIPLNKVASFFSTIGGSLVIEFVPKSDSQVQRLLAAREDIFPDYTQENFEHEFSIYFVINKSEKLKDSGRNLYMMTKKNTQGLQGGALP